jgi:uncharacterized protein YndB with AHSA1/START domain
MHSAREDRIEQTVEIPAAPGDVYRALTDPAQHSAFTGMKAEGEPRVGGSFSAFDGYISARYLELEPGRRIVEEWKTNPVRGARGWPENTPPSILEIMLEPAGKGTKLTMLQRDVPPKDREQYDAGWRNNYWEPLKKYFAKQ